MSNHFTHLHLHTEFSLLDGAIRIPDLVKHAKEQQWSAVGISDHGNIFGAVKFFQEAKKANIKPILGAEMYLAPDATIKDAQEKKYYHLLVMVQNREGYKNLCRLMAFAHQEGYYFKPRIDYERLKQYSEGLIISTACLGGHIPTLLREGSLEEAEARIQWFLDIFGRERFFMEVMPVHFDKQQITNDLIFSYAQKHNVRVIATGDAHYMHPCDREAHEIMLSVQTKDVLSNPDRYSFGEALCHLKSTDEMLAAFPANPEVIWNTGEIADKCDFAFEFGKLHFPQYPIPQEHTQESYFSDLCLRGLTRLKEQQLIAADAYEIYDNRLQREINLIVKEGYIGYFLVVSDFIQWAKRQEIPVGPGRGSAVGSLVSWALEITNVDPLKYNLLFERFLNPERVSMPDIDIDFCIEGREKVIQYVKEKYGHDCVCQIITFGTMMAKGVIKDVARVLGFPFQDANAITDLIPDQLKITLTEALEQEPRLKELMQSNPKVHHLMDVCFKLEGLTRHASKHAAGVVISPEPLNAVLPLYIPPKTNELVTQYAMTELESLGYLKIDFLGLTNLTVIDRTLKTIKHNHGITLNLDTLALTDAATFALLCKGHTSGVFQFESEGIKEVLRKLQPAKFEDLIAVNALYRPGPLGSGMVDDYIERRHGRKKTTYMFPELAPILEETYGVIVYQEQVMKIASTVGGYTLGNADILRRAMGKKKADVMAEQKAQFVAGAFKGGFDEKKASELFDLVAYFAGYGFNKSHSAAYALIAYHTAYLKANYPIEFMAALLTFETGNPDKLSFYLAETRAMGITTFPPDINRSGIEFTATPQGVLFGLQGIRNVGAAALEQIIAHRQERPFSDLLDFCQRLDLRTVNKRVIENLIAAGAFDALPGNRAQKTAELEKIIARAQHDKEAARTGQMGLFDIAPTPTTPTRQDWVFDPLDDWSTQEKLTKEKEVAGFYLSAHPLDTYKPLATAVSSHSLQELALNPSLDGNVTVCGLVKVTKVLTTKKGDRMAFAAIEDQTTAGELVLFPRAFKELEPLLAQHTIFVVKGSLDPTSEKGCKIKVDAMVPVDRFTTNPSMIRGMILTLPDHGAHNLLATLSELLEGATGQAKTTIRFKENNLPLVLTLRRGSMPTLTLLECLERMEITAKLDFSA